MIGFELFTFVPWNKVENYSCTISMLTYDYDKVVFSCVIYLLICT
jgi:hypothetical protein